jgi:hypothetical protein
MQLSLSDSNDFISIGGKSWGSDISMHSNCDLRSVRERLCSNFHVTSVNENVSSIEETLMRWVRIRSE